ncbi:MAG: PP2C family protein-serine/threonine phosphatase, partial [Planctomycetota bacterium]
MVGLATSGDLLDRLTVVLPQLGAGSARLYLLDSQTMTFYPIAAFGCAHSDEEIAAETVLIEAQPDQHLLSHDGDPVGLLTIPASGPVMSPALSMLIAMLGPLVVSIRDHEQLSTALRAAYEQNEHLVTAGRLLRHLDLEVLLVETLQVALRAVEAEVGALLTVDEQGVLAPRATWGLTSDHVAAIRLADGGSLAETVLADGEVLCLLGDALAQQLDLSDLAAELTGLLALPLIAGGERLGVVILANPSHTFSDDSERLAQAVCDLAAIALNNASLVAAMVERERLGRELDIARQVQAGMFPAGSLTCAGVAIHGLVRSCDETGGDYYTYIEREGRVVAMIADVTGHGLGAALFTTAAHAIIQQQLAAGADLLPALTVLNQGLYLTPGNRFLTTILAEVDPASGCCRYYSAGHNPALWLHGDEIRWLDSISLPLGILPSYGEGTAAVEVQLVPGDL